MPHRNFVRAYLAGEYDPKETDVTDEPDLTTYEGQLARLDHDYIKGAGEALQARLFGGFSGGIDMESTLTTRLAQAQLGTSEDPVHLDLDQARAVARFLQPPDGSNVQMPVAISYQPGNMTAYHLVFTPVRTMQQASTELGSFENIPHGCFNDGIPLPGYVIVAKINGSQRWAGVFDLGFEHPVPVGDVVKETRLNIADGAAIVALFRAITGVKL